MPPDNEDARRQPGEPLAGADTDSHKTQDATFRGWVKMMRGQDRDEMLKANPLAYLLASVIADRARWSSSFNRHGLAVGEAMLGDHADYGMSERQYRTAKQQLEKWGFAKFTATNKGTVGRLTDSRLFEVFSRQSDDQTDTQPTDSRRASDGQPTTNKTYKNEKKEKNQGLTVQALIPDVLQNPDFLKAWDDWLNHRRQSRKALTAQTQYKQLEFLAGMGAVIAVQSIQQSILNGWQGLFPVKPENTHSYQHQRPQPLTPNYDNPFN